ncbi:potassium transporter TrkH [Tateyamaria omphalii]|uniref:TrkH family potassium uptake protein n=1 Tax=Tateyamaria omphalii TaxID=299262 RepID=UPI00167672B2|nr:TrkH family potassium uptake protein [Tateyamaria omphalii]GGX62298.1 potassium transporter TrkH [Tateyamaria omphalii]
MSGRAQPRQPFWASVLQLPLFLLLVGLFSAAMLVPAVYGGIVRDLVAARAFLYSGVLGLVTFALIGLAHAGRDPRHGTLGPLLSLMSTFVVLPVILAVPFYEGLRTTTFLNAYVEMVSAITTTGATMFDDPERLNGTLHLWRSIVGWLGGMVMWVAASAILAPLNLGGFEVTARAEPGRSASRDIGMTTPEVRERLAKVSAVLIPIYAGLTMLLWVLLAVGGETGLVALCHAMAILATSGISPVGGLERAGSGMAGEAVMLLFMLFALSRLTFSTDTTTAESGGLFQDPEFRIGVAVVIAVPVFLFLRHFLGAFDVDAESDLADAGRALWGSAFTVLSFLTTTGFASANWVDAQAWSGLETPGLLLMGLALIGGGVATTAGGVKLLRVFALYRNGVREMERLVHPSSVSSAGPRARRLQKDGAFIAWIFFMLFALTLALITMLLTLTGVAFDTSLVLAVSGLSTTGPLLGVATDAPIALIELNNAAKAIFTAAMVLGRLETLAIIALFTPDLWRG